MEMMLKSMDIQGMITNMLEKSGMREKIETGAAQLMSRIDAIESAQKRIEEKLDKVIAFHSGGSQDAMNIIESDETTLTQYAHQEEQKQLQNGATGAFDNA